MVSFCNKCGFLLVPKKNKRKKEGFVNLYCNFCKKNEERDAKETVYTIKTSIQHGEQDRSLIFDEDFNIDPIINQTCPKCGHLKAYYWEGGDRRKSEWEPLTYFRCLRCKNTWHD